MLILVNKNYRHISTGTWVQQMNDYCDENLLRNRGNRSGNTWPRSCDPWASTTNIQTYLSQFSVSNELKQKRWWRRWWCIGTTAKLIHSLLYKYPPGAAVTISGKGSWSERLDCRLRSVIDRAVRSSRVCYINGKIWREFTFLKNSACHTVTASDDTTRDGTTRALGFARRVPRWRRTLRLGHRLTTFLKWGHVGLWCIAAL